jgi:hypothetical protein
MKTKYKYLIFMMICVFNAYAQKSHLELSAKVGVSRTFDPLVKRYSPAQISIKNDFSLSFTSDLKYITKSNYFFGLCYSASGIGYKIDVGPLIINTRIDPITGLPMVSELGAFGTGTHYAPNYISFLAGKRKYGKYRKWLYCDFSTGVTAIHLRQYTINTDAFVIGLNGLESASISSVNFANKASVSAGIPIKLDVGGLLGKKQRSALALNFLYIKGTKVIHTVGYDVVLNQFPVINYRFNNKGSLLAINLGYSHRLYYK